MNRSLTVSIVLVSVFVSYCGCHENDSSPHPNCGGEGDSSNHPTGNHASGNHPGESPNGHPPSNHPEGNPASQPGGTGNHPSGHFGGNINGKFTVVISFDSLDAGSGKLFNNQLKPIYKEFSECCYWQFIPCSTSHIVDDVLKCKDGVAECQIDVLHACAAHFYENDQHKLGVFFICMMSYGGNEYTAGEKCAKEAGMCWETLNKCQPSKDAGAFCDNRYKQLNALHEENVPGIMYNYKYDAQAEKESMTNLKAGICNQIKKNNMKCAACGNSGGGGGGGGNCPGGNSHDSDGHHHGGESNPGHLDHIGIIPPPSHTSNNHIPNPVDNGQYHGGEHPSHSSNHIPNPVDNGQYHGGEHQY